ncbi:MAG: hypothetical protein HUK06_09830 [Bacteroidaceae bacterium]|nr:hypothetical protein [Bacteroidaceae bacterium]
MNKTLKTLAAIAIVCSLGFAITSCKSDDSDPSTDTTYAFKHTIGFPVEMTKLCDITLEHTGLDGKKTTTNITDCPKTTISVNDKKVELYVFTKVETTKKKPSETNLKITYTAKTITEFPITVTTGFSEEMIVGIPVYNDWAAGTAKKTNTLITYGLQYKDQETVNKRVESLNSTRSNYKLKIDSNGTPSVN